MSLTWNEAAPPELPPLTFPQKIRGGLRVAGLFFVTGVCLFLFVALRFLRRRLLPSLGWEYFVARMWARIMLRLMGVRRRVVGAPIRTGGVWLVNHASWSDILALRSVRLTHFVSKAEVRGWPGVGWIAETAETVFIERRRSMSGAHRSVLAERLRRGQLLTIFAEGTSSDGLRVLPFKSALLAALFDEGLPETARVQPVTLNWIAPPGLPREFFGWWGGMPFEGHIWDVVCRSSGGEVEIVLHEPRAVGDFDDRKEMAQWAEGAVRSAKRSG